MGTVIISINDLFLKKDKIFIYGIGENGVNRKSMNNTRIKHFRHEHKAWIRLLDYMQQENVFLKNHLADIVKNEIAPQSLERIEYFQGEFVNKDVLITLLRYDIAQLQKQIENRKETGDNKSLLKKQGKMRSDIAKMENEFSDIRFQFNDYVASSF